MANLRTVVWQSKAQAAYAVGLGVITFIAAAVAFVMYQQHNSEMGAYQSASKCASPGDALNGQGCRYDGQTEVLSTRSAIGSKRSSGSTPCRPAPSARAFRPTTNRAALH